MTTPAKIEPWMKLAAEHIEDAYTVAIQQQVVGTEPAIVEVAYIIAAHAPEQEWEAKEKALRELANEWASFSWAPFMNPAARLKAILNTPAASGRGEREN